MSGPIWTNPKFVIAVGVVGAVVVGAIMLGGGADDSKSPAAVTAKKSEPVAESANAPADPAQANRAPPNAPATKTAGAPSAAKDAAPPAEAMPAGAQADAKADEAKPDEAKADVTATKPALAQADRVPSDPSQGRVVPASASLRLDPPAPSGLSKRPEVAAIAAFATAWATGKDIASLTVPDGLAVAIADEAPRTVGRARLRFGRRLAFPTAECKRATLSQIAGQPLVDAYYSVDARVSEWPSERKAWSNLRCFGFDAPGQPPQSAVRACVAETPDGLRMAAIQVSMDERPPRGERLYRPRPTAPKGTSTPKSPADAVYNVVLVGKDDTLNARAKPSADAEVVHRFKAAAKRLRATKAEQVTKGKTRWLQVETPDGPGWVNRHFVARARSVGDMKRDPRYTYALYDLVDSLGRRTTPNLGQRGLFIINYGKVLQLPLAEFVSRAAQVGKFDGSACEDCITGSIRTVVGGGLTDVLHDIDAERVYGRMKRGPNPSWRIPVEFSGFNLLAVYDRQDLPCGGYDWTTAAFFFDDEQGQPRLVGVGFDNWSP